jgi:hypothetical protein
MGGSRHFKWMGEFAEGLRSEVCWPRGLLFDLRSSLLFQVECKHAMFGFHV